MSEDKAIENKQSNANIDPKAKMLAALAKKYKVHYSSKSSGPSSRSKVGVGQRAGKSIKMHRRKAGSI